MPVFNAEKYLAEAIESILVQNYKNFEFLIFNDGSTDRSSEIISTYSKTDNRIKAYNYHQNTGYVKHLNEGLSVAKGKYIARMDADDISLPFRFEKQVNFLEQNLNVGLVGSSFQKIDSFGVKKGKPVILNGDIAEIEYQMIFGNYFAHPSIMFRRECLSEQNIYKSEYMPAEDYEFIYNISKNASIFNLSEVLLHYRIHNMNISSLKSEIQKVSVKNIFRTILTDYSIPFSERQLDLHVAIYLEHIYYSYELVSEIQNWYSVIKNRFNSKTFNRVFKSQWFYIFNGKLTNGGMKSWLTYYKTVSILENVIPLKKHLSFLLKCLLKWDKKIV